LFPALLTAPFRGNLTACRLHIATIFPFRRFLFPGFERIGRTRILRRHHRLHDLTRRRPVSQVELCDFRGSVAVKDGEMDGAGGRSIHHQVFAFVRHQLTGFQKRHAAVREDTTCS